MVRKNMSLEDSVSECLDEWAAEKTNNNTSRLVEEITGKLNEIVDSTPEDNPLDALDFVLTEYPGYDASGDYDANDLMERNLYAPEIEEMCEADPVPEINPEHVSRGEIRNMDTWIKSGLIAGMLRHKTKNERWEEIRKSDVTKLRAKFCGARSRVSVETIGVRYDESLPELEKVDCTITVSRWIRYVNEMIEDCERQGGISEWMGQEKYEDVNLRIEQGKELHHALQIDGDNERAEKVHERLDWLEKVLLESGSRPLE